MKKINFVAEAELVLKIGDLKILTEHRIELLRQIALTKNLTKSAKLAGYSYKGAWDVIDSITRETGDTVIARVTGGKGGGHTVVTAFGESLIKNFDLVKSCAWTSNPITASYCSSQGIVSKSLSI